MPKDIHQRDTAQQRSSRLLLAMGIIVLLGALAYFVLTLVVNRRTPASPDTRYTAENGISVYYESAVWPVCEMTEDATLGRALELASAQSSDDANYQVVLFQKGTKDTYEDFIGQSEKELKQAYGVISPRKVNLNIDGAAVTAVRCDIQAYYAVLATIEYDNHIPDLDKAIANAGFFMEKGGVLLFDMNTPYKHRNVLGENVFTFEEEDASCVWRNHYSAADRRVEIRVDIDYRETGEHFHEQFYEYTYDLDTIRAALEKHGFALESVCDGESFGPLTDESERYFFCAVKQYTQLEEQ